MNAPRLGPGTARKLSVSVSLAAVIAVAVGVLERSPGSDAAASTGGVGGAAGPVLELVAEVLSVFPHDPAAYTQGLLWHEGALFESTGNYGRSSLRKVELTTGRVQQRVELPGDLFGEGLARVGDRLFQLTWREGVVLEWDLQSFEVRSRHELVGEGWGLCYDGERLILSDGGSRLSFRRPDDFGPMGEVTVRLRGEPLPSLNELECAEGWVYANLYGSERIVRIDAQSGEVVAVIDASGLVDADLGRAGVLNGIAYNGDRKTFYLTGKNWSKLFEVVFVGAG
jgi:glutaminyl-peptide cyclotransferase